MQHFLKNTLPPPSLVAPAPWTLTGHGIILLYRFPKKWVEKNGFLADYQRDSFKGVLGSVMLVDYHTTPVGPYQELLFIPGLLDLLGKNTFSISKIYVSSHDSVWNGLENWGIPKEQCDFDVKTEGREEHFEARLNGIPFFEAHLQRGGFSFPLTTALFPLRITQRLRENLVLTRPQAKGKAYWATLKDLKVNATFFPDLAELKPLAALIVKDFEMTFPVATFKKVFENAT